MTAEERKNLVSIFNQLDNLENVTNRLEFLLNSSYSLMYMHADENGEITKPDTSGFWSTSESILNDLRSIGKELRSLPKS